MASACRSRAKSSSNLPRATRRRFLADSFAAALIALAAPEKKGPYPFLQQTRSGSRLLGTVPFGVGSPGGAPLGRLLGEGLDARLFTDLSTLTPETLLVPNERFFVRTAAPETLPSHDAWRIDVTGRVRRPHSLTVADLQSQVAPAGTHVIECSGNVALENYGLISTARWDGVPLTTIIDRAQPSDGAYRILVSGFDDETRPARTSVRGASWIFSRGDLEAARAFLALRMNGEPLPRDHGAPVRLIVPGWYGCACIKWVNRIELVIDQARPTPQMREFAQRTHQNGQPALARDFLPATIDLAATAVRVEKWMTGDRIAYRVVGIVWGGTTPTNALQIRFKASQSWIPIEDCPLPASTSTWSLWTHWWRPETPGRYDIVVRCSDPSIRTRRLDVFFYIRSVDIEEV